MIQKCGDPCQQLKNNNQKQPLQPHELPERPRQKVGADLFQWNKKDYLIIAGYYSLCLEVCELHSTSLPAVINKTKSFFACHGIPEIGMSDNGPQFIADGYKNSAASYRFYHEPSSPRYPQSIGLIEGVIPTVKNTFEKAKLSKKVPYIALLQLHNTPIDGRSPAQVLLGRTQLRTNFPIKQNSLKPKAIGHKTFKEICQGVKKKMKENFNRVTRKLQRLQSGETVRVQVEPRGNGEHKAKGVMNALPIQLKDVTPCFP